MENIVHHFDLILQQKVQYITTYILKICLHLLNIYLH